MAVEVTMPQLSDTMETGTIVNWLVEEGDTVERGDIIAEIETDKATMDLEAFDGGVLLKKLYDEGDEVPTQSLIAVIGEEGEDISDILEDEKEPESTEEESVDEDKQDEERSREEDTEEPDEPEGDESATQQEKTRESTEQQVEETSEPVTKETEPATDGERLRISPVARRMATKYDVDVGSLSGSGPQGRIVKRDVLKAIEDGTRSASDEDLQVSSSSRPSQLRSERQELSGMRSTIARRMTEAFRDVPHFYLEQEVDVEPLLDVRDDLSEEHDQDYSLNDLVLFAVTRALRQHPKMNATFEEEYVQLHDSVDLAFAVAVEDGLFTPVIHSADTLSLQAIRERSQEYVRKARNGNLAPEDYKGGTFTVSNLGMFEVDNFKAVINPPQAGILAVGTVREKPVATDGAVTTGRRMNVTLSCDHRSVDGVIGARFLGTFKKMVQNPYQLFI